MLRVARMRASSSSRDTTSTSRAASVRPAPRWRRLTLSLIVAIVLGLGTGVWQARADQLLIWVHPLLLAVGGAGYMGLLAGVTTDIVLRARSRFLRFVTAMAMLLAWMVASALGAVLAGVDSLHVVVGAGYWLEFGQLVIGGLGAVVAFQVCQEARRSRPRSGAETEWVADRRGLRPQKASLLRRGLVAGLILSTLLGLGLGYTQAYAYYRLSALIPALAVALAGAGFLGLLAGGWCRLALQDRVGVLRFTTALLILAAGLAVAQGVYVFLRGSNPLLGYTTSEALWTTLGQLAVGGMCIVVASLVWRPEPFPSIPRRPSMPAPAPEPRRRTVAPQPRSSVRVRRGPRFRLPPLRLPGRVRGRGRFKTRVIAAEEDRCPYCLDLVASDDPRGTVVCKVCGTPHHADCWEVAGSKCQVPHLNV